MRQRIMVAMSGGVDSSVAAALLVDEGHDVVGATLKLWCYGGTNVSAKSCCSLRDIEDAKSTAATLGIPHYVLDEEADFEREVVDPFVQSYLDGETPNPCVRCNTELKFGSLLARARKLGFDAVATGHYARIDRRAGEPVLRRGLDHSKDQSYVLWGIERESLSHTRFPVGAYSKDEIRKVALDRNLVVAKKPDSQDICFVQGGGYGDFVADRAQEALQAQPGDVVTTSGRPIGTHKGVIHYTVGQRRGLGIAAEDPLYVVGVNARENQVIVGGEQDLLRTDMQVRQVNWVSCDPPREPVKALVKVRYRAVPVPATVHPGEESIVRVDFAGPVKSVAPGQSAAFYDGDVLLGGGVIRG